MKITSGVPPGASARMYAPFATFFADASVSPSASPSPRSNTGMFWRVSAMPAGPLRRSRMVFQAQATSLASPGRTTVEVRDGAQRRELLDRLVRRAVLAEGDGVVRPDEDRRDVHERRQAERRALVVAEDQERAAERAGRAVQHDAVEDRGHGVLADAEVQHAAVRVAGPLVGRALGRHERRGALDGGVVRLGEVGGAAPQLGHDVGDRVDAPCRSRRGSRRPCPARRPGGRSRGRAARRESSRSSSCLRSGFASAQASKPFCHSACSSAPRSTALRVCSMTSSATSKVWSGSKPSTSLTARSSSAPRAEPWILPVFCFFGDGQPMIVLRMISDGLSVTGLGVLDGLVQLLHVLLVDAGLLPVDHLDVPVVGLVARLDVLGEGDVGVVLDRDLVAVVDRDQVAELLVAGERRRLAS